MAGITQEALCQLFPFNFKLGRDMTFLEVSPRLSEASPRTTIGADALDSIKFTRPILNDYSYEELLQHENSAIILSFIDIGGVPFKGQLLRDHDCPHEVSIVIKPSATSIDGLTEAGFTLSDFAPSDALPDLLLSVQLIQTNNDLLRKKNRSLSEQVVVNNFLTAIYSCETMESLYLCIATAAAKALNASDVIVYKVESGFASQVAGAGSNQTALQVTLHQLAIPAGKGVVGKAIVEKKSQLVLETKKCEYYIRDSASLNGSEISVPIIYDGQVIAVIDSESDVIGHFSLGDCNTLEMLAALAGPYLSSLKRRLRAQTDSLAAAQRLRRKNLTLQSISHEFRTPLSQISSGVQLLSKHGLAMEAEERQDILESFLHPIGRLKKLFSMLMSDHSEASDEIVQEDFCLLRLFDRIAKECLRPYGREDDLTISASGEELIIYSSKESLTQIIINLLVNAAKYSQFNTQIILSAEIIGNRVVLTVSDFGIGISEDHLGAIFEPHMRSEQAIAMAEGAGFGLSIVRDTVQALGGHVSVTSTEGLGSNFKVSLPKTA